MSGERGSTLFDLTDHLGSFWAIWTVDKHVPKRTEDGMSYEMEPRRTLCCSFESMTELIKHLQDLSDHEAASQGAVQFKLIACSHTYRGMELAIQMEEINKQ